MAWVFAARYNDSKEEKDLNIPPIRFFSNGERWHGEIHNCKKWDSAEGAMQYMQDYYGFDRKKLLKWMLREMIQLEQL